MSKEFQSVFDLCIFIFGNSANISKSLLKGGIKLYASYIKWYPLEYVFKEDVLYKFIDDMIQSPSLRLDIMKYFGEVCNYFI